MNTSRARALPLVLAAAAVLAITVGCDGTSSSATMTCKDFLDLDGQAQQSAWVKAADAAKRPQVATGGGMMNGISVCQGSPDASLSEVAGKVSAF